jgi:DNA repair protein RecN (Recombination protein N)
VDDRLNTLNRILNKYGNTFDQAMAYREEIGKKIADLEQSSQDLSSLKKNLTSLGNEVIRLGRELSSVRKQTATKLGPLIEKQLAELGMEKARFSISIETSDFSATTATPSGFDLLEFVAQTNPGMLPQPLRKIASGGELGRIMLALKGILADTDRISVLVFDEIDANIGGRLGAIIGRKLRALAEHHQVLCITHLPQIASYADRHLTVRKEVAGKETRTTVRHMHGDERIEELAEMIGGQRITETTRAQARELLTEAGTRPTKSAPAPKSKKPTRNTRK